MSAVPRVSVAGTDIPLAFSKAENERAVAIMCHGGPGGNKEGPADLFVKLSQGLSKLGVSCVRFDFRGSGESGLPFSASSIGTMVEDLRAVHNSFRHEKHTIVIAESLGATVCLAAAIPDCSRILLWPAADLSDTEFGGLVTSDNLRAAESDEIVDLGWEKFSAQMFKDILATKLYENALRLPQKTLLIHGEQDSDVPVRQARILQRVIGERASLRTFANGKHGLKSEPEQSEAIATIISWVTERV